MTGEPAEPNVQALLREGDAAITSVNLAEVVDVMARTHGIGADRTRAIIDPLLDDALGMLAVDAGTAWRAGGLRATYYHPTSCRVSLADCVLLACAREGDRIATSDRPVIDVARAEGIATLPLPDSTGRLP